MDCPRATPVSPDDFCAATHNPLLRRHALQLSFSPLPEGFPVTGHEIRQRFLDFFAERGHRIVRSSSLVPANDPTLLFTNAGMNQFKDVFLGMEKRDYARATTSQKCVRAGGKHNDLENVGYTRRHHTFFEMLGNFSFGDYFKSDAIQFAWDLVTKDYGLPKDRLYVTVFREDDEAEELWQKVAGVPKERIFRLDEKDNFWQMGETGPCGPCSEIHYDLGAEAAEPGREHERFPDDGGGRFVEIWNLVFMQFDRDAGGKLTPLPRPSIDTGMGLERVAAVKQGKLTNYETDLIFPIIERAGELFNKSYSGDARVDTALRIAADHARATAFLIHDGVIPANDGRGYVLRKIMRRAMRNARLVGVEEPFLYKLTGFVAEHMRDAYPEMMESVQRVARVVKDEEHRYATTFLVAEKMFHQEIKNLQSNAIPGALSFKLYDTYGLALDEQEEMAREHGLTLDRAGFDREMEQQRDRARASWKGAEKGVVVPAYQKLLERGRTKFLGYNELEATSRVIGLLIEKQPVDSVPAGAVAELVFDQTPLYAEAGGQVGDHGALYAASGEKIADVEGVFSGVPGLSVHRITTHAAIHVGDTLRAEVAAPLRAATRRNHTATHLLHASLRQVLGTHVKQAGSVVEPGRLRFDFTHYAAMDRAELEEVERLMNEQILKNTAVETNVMRLDQAIQTGAMALFGEKYGDQVRVVNVPGFSRELCGGMHVGRTGDIGVCKIVYEGSISAGVRRIEAVTGEGALRQYQESADAIKRIANLLKAGEPELVEHIEKLLAAERAQLRQVDHLKSKLAQSAASALESQAHSVNGATVLTARIDGMDRGQLRELADSFRNRWKSAVVVLASVVDDGVSVVAAVTKDLTTKVHAGKLAGAVAQAAGGKGGGRPDMAEGGGKDASAIEAALANVYREVESKL
jgi:alanyl-tRNA synthetase